MLEGSFGVPLVPLHTVLVGKSRCIMEGNVGAGGNSLLSNPKRFKYRPTLTHCPTKTFPQAPLT